METRHAPNSDGTGQTDFSMEAAKILRVFSGQHD
jgi:hypothetical protein